MFPFGKSAQQKRIDDLVYENAALRQDLASTKAGLAQEKERRADLSGRLLREINRGNRLAGKNADAYRALRDIAGWVTPGAAYAARKMARRAQGALPVDLAASSQRPNGTAAAVPGVA